MKWFAVNSKKEKSNREKDRVKHENAEYWLQRPFSWKPPLIGQEHIFCRNVREKDRVSKPMQIRRDIGWVILLHIL